MTPAALTLHRPTSLLAPHRRSSQTAQAGQALQQFSTLLPAHHAEGGLPLQQKSRQHCQQRLQQACSWQQLHLRRSVRCRSGGHGSDGGGTGGGGDSGGKGKGGGQEPERLQNFELLVGDCLCLLCFALYKQITAIIFLPNFPGWLAPLAFNPTRFLEFFSFAATLLGTWVASGLLTGGYKFSATADPQAALSRTCYMWLISMPVAAAQLVLLTAAEDGTLVGEEGFASMLPLAATGPGEPFVTAAGVLGLMCVWRAFYASYLDIFSFGKMAANSRDRQREMEHFADSLRGAMLLSLASCAVLQLLGQLVGEERLEMMASSLFSQALAAGVGGA